MEFTKLLNDLSFSPQVIHELEKRRDLIAQYQSLLEGMTLAASAEGAYLALAEKLGDDDMGMLACQIAAAAMTRWDWPDDQVFLDTMKCFPRFLGETLRKTGKVAFDRGWWTYRQLSMQILRIGQLEYELRSDRKDISLHIPSDACIAPEAVDASLTEARTFLSVHFPEYAQAPMGCGSWLLSPELTPLLPENSRILAFQKRFRILKANQEARDVWEWLFQTGENTPIKDLREDTSLQRSVKKKLLEGGSIGVAEGILMNNDE